MFSSSFHWSQSVLRSTEFPPLLYRVCPLHKIFLSSDCFACTLEPCSSQHCSIFTYLILSFLSCLFPLALIVVMIHISTGWVGSFDSKLSPEKGFCSFPRTSVSWTERRCSGISRRSSSSILRPNGSLLDKRAK